MRLEGGVRSSHSKRQVEGREDQVEGTTCAKVQNWEKWDDGQGSERTAWYGRLESTARRQAELSGEASVQCDGCLELGLDSGGHGRCRDGEKPQWDPKIMEPQAGSPLSHLRTDCQPPSLLLWWTCAYSSRFSTNISFWQNSFLYAITVPCTHLCTVGSRGLGTAFKSPLYLQHLHRD